MKIQKELDETKIVLHKTIESVLERGEKIDTLVAKSNDLSGQSKMFYKQVCVSVDYLFFFFFFFFGNRSSMFCLLSKGVYELYVWFRQRIRTRVALSCRWSFFESGLEGVVNLLGFFKIRKRTELHTGRGSSTDIFLDSNLVHKVLSENRCSKKILHRQPNIQTM